MVEEERRIYVSADSRTSRMNSANAETTRSHGSSDHFLECFENGDMPWSGLHLSGWAKSPSNEVSVWLTFLCASETLTLGGRLQVVYGTQRGRTMFCRQQHLPNQAPGRQSFGIVASESTFALSADRPKLRILWKSRGRQCLAVS